MDKKVKLGVVGLGNMGTTHLKYLSKMNSVEIVGVCDLITTRADYEADLYSTTAYYNHSDMINKSGLEAILICVPHYDHVPISIEAFEKQIHVLCEKPISVHANLANKMLTAYEKAKLINPKLVFGLMFQERTLPQYKKIKDIILGGELGKLTRVTWINTQWFRSQTYYDSGGWRATWSGEGGGILTNQCPHNLDMYNWLFGLPNKVNGFAHIGKYHDIEVEDEVTAYLEHDNGMIAHFIVTTGEMPGTNRFEIAGENGSLVYENSNLTFYRNRESMLKYTKETKESFKKVENWEIKIPIDYEQQQGHQVVTEKFINSIISGEIDLIAFGEEGLNPVMLANAIMLSSFEEKAVHLPMNGDAFENKLNDLIKNSKFEKKVVQDVISKFGDSTTK